MSMKKWPVVVDRSVTQPSRVKLTPAPEAGSNAYDLTPAPGAVLSEGTLLNQALFHGMQCYIDQNDLPVIHLSSEDRVNFVGECLPWAGLTAAEIAGRVAVFHKTDAANPTTLQPAFTINGNITAQKVKAQIIIPVAQGANA